VDPRAWRTGRRPLRLSVRDLPRVHLVTDGEVLTSPGFLDLASRLLETGGGRVALHVRGHGVGGGRLWALTTAFLERAQATGSLVAVNDRLDVALAGGAPAVQLGHRSLRVGDARRLVGPQRLIGVSVHDVEEGRLAVANGADFVFAGTLYPSASHPGARVRGTRWIEELAALGRPVLGIGGIEPERVREVRSAGAYGVALIRGVWAAPDPAGALLEYLNQIE
jgi:thiamine-phosphate diphosphorylase